MGILDEINENIAEIPPVNGNIGFKSLTAPNLISQIFLRWINQIVTQLWSISTIDFVLTTAHDGVQR
jgi:hypothetical protein